LKEALPRHDDESAGGSLAAPMPGRIIQVMARAGDSVKKGQALLILEAMKMEHTITAPADGVVKEIHFAAGEQVLEGAALVSLQ
jgi:3-methylcrotonyl-CoA carboxylase alpha subunit